VNRFSFAPTGRWLPVVAIPLIAGVLLAVGVLFVHSATAGPEDPFPSPLARSHLVRIAVASFLFLGAAMIDYRHLERLAPFLYAFGLSLLLALLAIKWIEGGVVRWFRFGNSSLQPSELVKLFSILLLARLIKNGRVLEQRIPLIPCLAVVGVPFLMVAAQPDLGTALVLVPITAAILWVGGLGARAFGKLGVAGLLVVLAGVPFLHEYQISRVRVFLGIAGEDAEIGHGYQVTHSMISIGSGGPTGKGLFLGTHHDLGYLPEDHNDFIFGVIGEEWGLLGSLATVATFLTLFLLVLSVAWRTREPFGRLVAVGVCTQLSFQTLINLGMTMGVFPVTGIPLPLISFGGTSMLVTMFGLGTVVAIALRPVESLHPDGLRSGTAERQGLKRVTVRARIAARA
jgi:rod shape determining protein RodA